MGPSGCGKSAVATQFALGAAMRGERVAVFAFDESLAMYRARADSLGMQVQPHLDAGRLVIQQIDPAELSPGEFGHAVRRAVEERNARLVCIDSLNGLLNAMPQENFVALQLHELLAYLGQCSVLTVMTVAQHGLVGSEPTAPVDVSYLADTVLLFRYFEAAGQVRKALSVVKKRSGRHEVTIRELTLGAGGVHLGRPLDNFQGVLAGSPQHTAQEGSPTMMLDQGT